MKSMLLTAVVCFMAMVNCNHLSAQEIEWGEVYKNRDYGIKYFNGNNGDYFCLGDKGRQLQKFNGEKLMWTTEVAGIKKGVAIKRFTFGDNFVIIYQVSKGKNIALYLQIYDSFGKTSGEVIPCGGYEFDKRKPRVSQVLKSENGKFFCVEYCIPNLSYDDSNYGYMIFNENFQISSEGMCKLNYVKSITHLAGHYLSNSGQFFLTMRIAPSAEAKKKNPGVYNYFKGVYLNGTETQEIGSISFKGLLNFNIVSSNENAIEVVGMYDFENKEDEFNKGVYYMNIDFREDKILSEDYMTLSEEQIMSSWTKKHKEGGLDYAFMETYTTDSWGVEEYVLRKKELLENNEMIFLFEEYHLHGVSGSGYSYYFSNILAYKVNSAGKIEWLNKTDKKQWSTGSPYLGFYSFLSASGELLLLFNDHTKNYSDESFEFTNPDELYVSTSNVSDIVHTINENCVAVVKINSETGKSTRSRLKDVQAEGMYLLPSECRTNYSDHELMIMLEIRTNKRVGFLKY